MSDNTGLVPRTFYFILEHSDLWGEGKVNDRESYHVEVAIYRLTVDGKDIERNKDGNEMPHVIRSWIAEERKQLRVVYAKGTPPCAANTFSTSQLGEEVDFTGPLQPYPTEGNPDSVLGIIQGPPPPGGPNKAKEQLPALVIASLYLEPDREHIAFARAHDGIQWGPWARIAQSRLDFVRAWSNTTIRDIQFSAPHPTIRAYRSGRNEKDTSPWKIPPKDPAAGGGKIGFTAEIRDSSAIELIFVNGRNVWDSHYPFGGTITWSSDKKEVTLKGHAVPVTEGCTRLEIVAQNEHGNRSNAVQVFLPVYDNDKQPGKVLHYEAASQEFSSEKRRDNDVPFQIRFYPIPYREMVAPSPQGGIECHLLVGINKPKPQVVPLTQSGNYCWEPYFGIRQSRDVWPKGLKPQDKDTSSFCSIMVGVKPIEGTENTVSLEALNLPPKRPLAWGYTSAPMTWSSGVTPVPAIAGDLLEAHVVTEGEIDQEEPTCELGGPVQGHCFGLAVSPLAAAADIYPVSIKPDLALSTLKNGDLIQIHACTILAKPVPRLTTVPYDFGSDETKRGKEDSNPPWPVWSGYHQNPYLPVLTWISGSLKANMLNWDDECQWDRDPRDEEDIPTLHDGLKMDKPDDKSPDLQDEGHRKYPGRVACFTCSTSFRLLTQAYRPDELSGPIAASGTELHQILPNGYLVFGATATIQEDTGGDGGSPYDPTAQPSDPGYVPGGPPDTGSDGDAGESSQTKWTLLHAVRVLEITKRWYIEGNPSVQPAFAGTNPRVGGPGTHRVQGLHHKQDDGSVYVHNGEFFQAAEDLHAKGKFLDLLFRRVHLSHSLFTTSVGRNWDSIGNVRLVEMLNGDVYLMNGEAGVEVYKFNSNAKSPIIESSALASMLVRPHFNYAAVYANSQYVSPPGAYRSLLKAQPVAINGMFKPDAGAEVARFYLVGKHGDIWTFGGDIRFPTAVVPGTPVGEAGEPPPGVRAQYLLTCIHHRNQQNYMKFQRDGKGLLRGIIDDMGRVTRLEYIPAEGKSSNQEEYDRAKAISFDMFLDSAQDFAGRKLSFRRSSVGGLPPRNLEGVDGPSKDPSQSADLPPGMTYKYAQATSAAKPTPMLMLSVSYTKVPSIGPHHRLQSVTDPIENSGQKRPYIEIQEWQQGQVTRHKVNSLVDEKRLADLRAKNLPKNFAGPITFVHRLTPSGNPDPGETDVTYRVEQDNPKVAVHVFHVRKQANRAFTEVVSDTVTVTGDQSGAGYVGKAATGYIYNDQGEIVEIQPPSGGIHRHAYSNEKSQVGNLLREETLTSAGSASLIVYSQYDTRFNVPKQVDVDAYVDQDSHNPYHMEYDYDVQGNIVLIKEPEIAPGRRSQGPAIPAGIPATNYATGTRRLYYRSSDGQLLSSISKRLQTCTRYYYYGRAGAHVPGDASDCAGMLGMINENQHSYPGPGVADMDIGEFESRWISYGSRQPNLTRVQDIITTIMPSLLGAPLITVDPNGWGHLRKFNSLSQVVRDRGVKAPAGQASGAEPVPDYCFRGTASAWRDSGIGVEYQYNLVDEVAGVTVPAFEGKYGGSVARRITLTDYDSLGNVVATCIKSAQRLPADLVSVARHDVWGNPVRTVDEAGNTACFIYDSRGLLTTRLVVDSSDIGAVLSLAVLGPTVVSLLRGAVVDKYAYDVDGNRIYHQDPLGWCESWTYDQVGRLTRALSKTGLVTELLYGHGGRLLRQTSYEGSGVDLATGGSADKGTQSSALALTRLKQTVNGLAQTLANTNNGNGSHTIYSDVIYGRDERGNVCLESRLNVSPLPNKTNGPRANFWYVWTNDDLPAIEKTDAGVPRCRVYDALGRLQTDILDTYRVTHTYDAVGNEVQAWTPDSNYSRYYDPFGNVLRVWSEGQGVNMMAADHDIGGNVLADWQFPDQKTTHQYDAAGREFQSSARYASPPGLSQNKNVPLARTYGANSYTVQTTRTFQADGRLGSESVLLGGMTSQVQYSEHCLFGPRRITTACNGNKSVQTVKYDAVGNHTQWTDAVGTRFEGSYNAFGGMTILVAYGPKNEFMHLRIFRRDAANRLIHAEDGQLRHYAGVDRAGNAIVESTRFQSYHTIINEFEYDTLGNMSKETQAFESTDLPFTREVHKDHSSTGGRTATEVVAAYRAFGNEDQSLVASYTLDQFDRVKTFQSSPRKWVLDAQARYSSFDRKLEGMQIPLVQPEQLALTMKTTLNATPRPDLTVRSACDKAVATDVDIGPQSLNRTQDYGWYGLHRDAGLPSETLQRRGFYDKYIGLPATQQQSTTHSLCDRPDQMGVRRKHFTRTVIEKLPGQSQPGERLGMTDRTLSSLLSKGIPGAPNNVNELESDTLDTRSDSGTGHITNDNTNHNYAAGSPERVPYAVNSYMNPLFPDVGTAASAPPSLNGSWFSFQRYRNGLSASEPEAVIHRNVFGLPVEMRNSKPTGESCFCAYDALGRLVLRQVPSAVHVPDVSPVDTITIRVGSHLVKSTETEGFAQDLGEALILMCRIVTTGTMATSMKGYSGGFRLLLTEPTAATTWRNWSKAVSYLAVLHIAGSDYPHLIIEGPDSIDFSSKTPPKVPSHAIELNKLNNIIFRNLNITTLKLTDCHGITVDRCYFSSGGGPSSRGVFVEGDCHGLQVQNCVFNNCSVNVKLPPKQTSVFVAHNRFEGGFGPVTLTSDTTQKEQEWSWLAVVNNLVLLTVGSWRDAMGRKETEKIHAVVRNNAVVAPRSFSYEPPNFVSYIVSEEYNPENGTFIGLTPKPWPLVAKDLGDAIDKARNGKLCAGKGLADVPGHFSGQAPVIADCSGRLRDPKHPTIGPIEQDLPGAANQVLYRYIHDGSSAVSRETYRYFGEGSYAGMRLFNEGKAEITRIVPVLPGTLAYMDDDGVTDIRVADREGQHLLWYRAREQRAKDGTWAAPTDMRGSGLLTPLNLPLYEFMEYPPFYQRLIEDDILAGRRGIAGWNGFVRDFGLLIPYWESPSQQVADERYSIDEPGFVEGLIPVWGSGRAALADFERGRIGWGIFNTAMAISDVFLAKALLVGAGKLVVKGVAKLAIRETAEVIGRETGEQVLRQGMARGERALGTYLAGVGGRVVTRAAAGYVGGFVIGAGVGKYEGGSFWESIELGNKYGIMGAISMGSTQLAFEGLNVLRFGRGLWYPHARPRYRPGNWRQEITRTFLEDRKTYRVAENFRSRWMLSGEAWEGHHWWIPRRAWDAVHPWFRQGSGMGPVVQRIGNAGIHTLMLPGSWHTLLFGTGSAAYRSAMWAAMVVEGYASLGRVARASYRLGGEFSDLVWGGVFDE